MLGDIQNPRLIYAKGLMFLVAGFMAAGLLLFEHPSVKVAALLAVSIWCFARAYYFVFYVIQHYVDPDYHFAGLGSFARYLVRKRTKGLEAIVTNTSPAKADG